MLRAMRISAIKTEYSVAVWLRWPMRKLDQGYVYFLILILGLSLGLPAPDISETSYDESEALPYLSTLSFSTTVPPEAASRTTRRVLRSLQLPLCATSRPVPASTNGNAGQRTVDARISFARLSTLRC